MLGTASVKSSLFGRLFHEGFRWYFPFWLQLVEYEERPLEVPASFLKTTKNKEKLN